MTARWRGAVVPLWCAILTVAILWPALAPGYVLAFDMVATPRPPLTWRSLGLADGLPRAVPQDAVVAVLALAVRGDLLQKFALVAVVFGAALGAARLVPVDRLPVRMAAAAGYAWSAYLGERLLLGHWGLLAAYATLPWLVRAALALRETAGRAAVARVVLCGAPAFLTPTGGVIALGTAAAVLLAPGSGRRPKALAALAGLAALTTPWIAAALLSPASGRSDASGVTAFAPRAENWSGTIGSLLTLGGVWNRGAAPASRSGWLAPILGIAVLALAVAGWAVLRRRWPAGGLNGLAVAAAVSLALAVAGAVPGLRELTRLAVEYVPGGGILRDGQKLIMPFALLVTVSAAAGAYRIASWLAGRGERIAATAALAAAVALPIAAMPDLAGGGLGRLAAVRYPAEWGRVAGLTRDSAGDLVTLPYSAFRVYGWNGRRTSLDPADRYLRAPVVVDDELPVRSARGEAVRVRGESGRAAQVRDCLAAACPLGSVGVRWVLAETDQPGAVPDSALAGFRKVYEGRSLTLYENPTVTPRRGPDRSPWRRLALAAAYLVALSSLAVTVIHRRVRK